MLNGLHDLCQGMFYREEDGWLCLCVECWLAPSCFCLHDGVNLGASSIGRPYLTIDWWALGSREAVGAEGALKSRQVCRIR